MSKPKIFEEFPSVSAKQWKQKIQFDLKGADYNETLVWESLEGIKVKPFYHAEDLNGLKQSPQTTSPDWKIGQHIYAGDVQKANGRALDSIERGAESLIITVPESNTDFKALLKDIDLGQTPLHFNFQFLNAESIARLLEVAKGKEHTLHLNIDPIGYLARSGNWYHDVAKDHQILEEIQEQTAGLEGSYPISIDMSLYQNAGGTMVQQLAYGMAHANEYLNHFHKDGSIAKALKPFVFKTAVGSNYFFEIAKLRALRWLWESLAESYGYDHGCQILAQPSRRNKTLYDYNVNLLRTTSECMSAVLGGADVVSNLPYDAIYHKDNEFGDRIARNQLLLLKEESYLSSAGIMTHGSYYIESLTQQLAEHALDLFKQIEASGGLLSELKKGRLQKKIKESAAKEAALFQEGQLVLLGTNKFQNPNDRMKNEMELFPFVKTNARKTLIEPIIENRLAEEMEQKRLDNE
nr:methylmalonyl-CoA mutase subunit beta [Allomuricauda sp.]